MQDPRVLTLDPWARLRSSTRARIGLQRCGDGIPTEELLRFQLDHAHARDAVYRDADFSSIEAQLCDRRIWRVRSAATDRAIYVRRPDLGRCLDPAGRALLAGKQAREPWDVIFIIADGLSSDAVNEHATSTLHACLDRLCGWKVAPIVLASQARVALGDEIAMLVNADQCVVLIGERPGLSVANSLGIYLTWKPRVGHRDADRNCISNIHADGLTYERAADKVSWLLTEARRRRLSGTRLKENFPEPRGHLLTPSPAQLENENLL